MAAILLVCPTAWAQAAGDQVRIETDSGTVEGVLVDKLPDGYLVRVGEESKVLKYASVKSIEVITPSTPEPAPELPPPDPPEPSPVEPPPPAPAIEPPPPRLPPPRTPPAPAYTYRYGPAPESPASPPANRRMFDAGMAFAVIGIIGIVAGAVLLPVGAAIEADTQCVSADGSLTFDCDYGAGPELIAAGAISLTVAANGFLGVAIPLIAVGGRPADAPRQTGARPAISSLGFGFRGWF